uniref:Large ribosomal subunit protein uL10m n=1 Tax=Culicoides sonorensis TaxID=179676 RepID=A0A336MU45_CULSO
MANILPKTLLRSSIPQIQFMRFRGKINIQRPQKNSYEKQRIIIGTLPIYPDPPYNQRCIQDTLNTEMKKKDLAHNPYNVIIAREVRNWFDHSKMICIFHMNPINAEEYFNARVAFHKQGMTLRTYGMNIMKLAIGGTKYETILPLFETKYCIVFSPEIKANQVLKIMKKIPQLHLMAGIAYDRYLSKNEFTGLATMPDLQMQRAQFAAILDSVGGQLVNNLQMHQTQLCSLLDLHAKGQEASEIVESSQEKAEVKETPVE